MVSHNPAHWMSFRKEAKHETCCANLRHHSHNFLSNEKMFHARGTLKSWWHGVLAVLWTEEVLTSHTHTQVDFLIRHYWQATWKRIEHPSKKAGKQPPCSLLLVSLLPLLPSRLSCFSSILWHTYFRSEKHVRWYTWELLISAFGICGELFKNSD